jgi:uncharacterized protein YbjT (DUF2867 family)
VGETLFGTAPNHGDLRDSARRHGVSRPPLVTDPVERSVDLLVTGATGFVGGRLVPRLLADGHHVRCLVRDPDRVTARWRADVELMTGRAEDTQAVWRAADGCDAAYFLVHGMAGTVRGLLEREVRTAAAFRDGVAEAGVRRIVYLGGLVDEAQLMSTSDHLYARHQVGEELRAGSVPVTELRAGIVLGAGSASFGMLVAAARAPVQLAAPWTASRTQPIALADLLELLVVVLEDRQAAWQVLDVGGPDVMTYGELVAMVREALGRRRAPRVSIPYLPPEATAAGAAALTGLDPALTLPLLQSAAVDAVVRDAPAAARYPELARTPVRPAIAAALA